jgi:predicted ATPase
MNERAISFGPFRLLAAQRLLLEGDNPVRLGSRAFDILAALVERPGEVVGKKELIARVWPKTFVEDVNLKIQVSALRRALGDGQGGHRYVVTVPGRGYNFVAPISEEHVQAPSVRTSSTATVHNLPFAATRMIGRDDATAAVASRLSRHRLVTIVGPGGIGKTTVALAIAERLISEYEHGVWLVDLAPIGDPRLVPTAVASVLRLDVRTEDSLPGLVAALKDRRILLLLDNCEHVIEAATGFATAVLNGAPDVNIMATSREPLGMAGEWAYRLAPLSTPQPTELTAAQARGFSAVQLFVERATAIVEDFVLTDANAPLVADICRRLDGLPLAIEFAAPRIEALGVEGLAAHLHRSLTLLKTRRRAGTPRHQTMRAVVDWSYGLLNWEDQFFFRALGIFSGGFTADAAEAVATDDAMTGTDAIDRLADLVGKSLVVADLSGARPRFRLLETTRVYALDMLREGAEHDRIARRHAEHFRRTFGRAEDEATVRPTGEWLADYAREIDNLRAALDWAFSPSGDKSVGIALAAAAAPLLLRLSLHVECRSRTKQALLAAAAAAIFDPRDEMRLQAALGTASPDPGEVKSGFTKALDIAESLRDLEYKLRGLGGLYYFHTASGQHRAASPFARKFHDLAMREADPEAQLFGEHIMGMAAHFLGDQTTARRHLERLLTHYAVADRERDNIRFENAARFQIDPQVSTHTFFSRALWLQGFSDQAVRAAALTTEKAQASGHALSLCYALALAACPIALWVGNFAAAALYTEMLLDESRRHGLPLWHAYGSRFRRILALRDSGLETALRQYDIMEFTQPDSNFQFFTGLGEMAEALLQAGHVAEALSLVDAAIERSEVDWLMPELLRLKGEALVLRGTFRGAQEEGFFRQALDGARRQKALSWELRASTSLARLLRDRRRPADAIACLQPIYGRFTEGFGTADLIAARHLLDELSDSRRKPITNDSRR